MTKLQLTIYVNETDMAGDLPLYELVVRRLHHLEVAGATVTRAVMGYGKHGKVHRKRLFGVSDDRPMVIAAMVPEGLMTIQQVEIV
jgi:PII-like signaling protein